MPKDKEITKTTATMLVDDVVNGEQVTAGTALKVDLDTATALEACGKASLPPKINAATESSEPT